jgi:hypothetical protein
MKSEERWAEAGRHEENEGGRGCGSLSTTKAGSRRIQNKQNIYWSTATDFAHYAEHTRPTLGLGGRGKKFLSSKVC